MVKFVAFEESFRDRCLRVPNFSYGIIIGGSLKEEECLFLPIEAPSRNEDDTDLFKSPRNISEIDEKWVARHCKSILRMIPGGVRISGLFATVTSEEVTRHESHLIKILSAMANSDKITFKELISEEQSDKLILYADPETKELFCKAVDLDDNKDHLRNVDIRIKPVLCQFKAVKTCVNISFSALLPTDRKKEKILKRLEEASEPFLSKLVHQTEILICGKKRNDHELLFDRSSDSNCEDSRQKKNLLKIKRALIDTSDSDDYWSNMVFAFYDPEYQFPFRVHSASSSESGASSDTGFTGSSSSLYSGPGRANSSNSRQRDFSGQRSASGTSPVKGAFSHQRAGFRSAEDDLSSDFCSSGEQYHSQQISVQGVIPGIAFLPLQTTTVASVKKAFREDLVRSTLSRLELLSDQLNISSGEFESPKIYLPQRVLVRLPACRPLPLSDYKFCSETQDEIVARLICLSLPLGSNPISDSQTSIPTALASKSASKRLSSSSLESDLQNELTPDSGNDSIADGPEIAIDASCVDFGLEATPNTNQQQPISEQEILQEFDQSIKNVAKHSNSMTVIMCAIAVLVLCLLIGGYRTLNAQLEE